VLSGKPPHASRDLAIVLNFNRFTQQMQGNFNSALACLSAQSALKLRNELQASTWPHSRTPRRSLNSVGLENYWRGSFWICEL
jgi:hypothetical protein